MIKQLLLVPALTSALCASTLTAQTTIERIAPENSVIVFGTRNFESAMQHVQNTQLWSLWQSEQMKQLRADAVRQFTEGMDEMFQELGVEKDSLVHPTGAAGFALFSVTDPELGLPTLAFIALADYGDAERADKTNNLIKAALQKGEEEGQLEYEEAQLGERTMISIDLSKMAQQPEDQADDMEDFGMPQPDPEALMKGLKQIHYVRDGNTLMFASSKETMEEALDVADGKPRAGGSVAEREDFQGLMSKLGESDVFGVLLTRDIADLLAPMDQMGMLQMMRPTLQALFGRVHGYGMSMRADAPNAMVEQTVVAYMPEGKQGLTALIDVPTAQAAVPSFVGQDAVSYSNFSFKFSGLVDVLRKVAASNPMIAAQAGPQLDAIAPTLNQIASMLGTQIHTTTSFTKPVTAASQQTLIAIECTKPQEFETFIAGAVAETGIEPRDFLGQRIYTIPEDMMQMMMPVPVAGMQSVSLGIGGGFVLLGATPAVEQGLRATSEPGGGTLAGSAEYQRALNALQRQDAIAWGFSDTVDLVEATLAVQKAMIDDMIEQMKQDAAEWGDDADMAQIIAEQEKQMRESMAFFDKIDFDLIRRYVGPSAWQVQSTDDALIMRSIVLDAGGSE